MRLRDLGLTIGAAPPGPRNSIADVSGVRVGHATITTPAVGTGVTVVVAGSAAGRLFVGRYSVDRGDGLTGLGVTEDFGAISAPVALVPAAAVGRIYDALIQRGLGVDPGLSEDTGWPPVVIGVNDSGLNLPADTRAEVREEHLAEALNALRGSQGNAEDVPDANPSASPSAGAASQVREGSVGIGAGLAAFGFRGGLGTSSRLQGAHVVGALVAVNGGTRSRLAVDGWPVILPEAAAESTPLSSGSFAAVLATDAPLSPRQLDHLAGRAAFGLVRVGLLEERTREGLVLALSTTGLVDCEPRSEDGTVGMRSLADTELPPLFAAAAEACEEAVLNGLLQADPLAPAHDPGMTPLRQQGLEALPSEGWPDEVRRQQQRHGRI